MAKTIRPAIVHFRCVLRKSSTLDQLFAFQAHSLPFAPRTNIMIRLTPGMRARSAIQTLFPIPQIHVRKNAPQFHPRTSAGASA